MTEQEERALNHYYCGAPPMPHPIVVQQIIGHRIDQKTIDIHVVVPRRKPAIEQVIDVFVRKLVVTEVQVLTNEVIVCGHFEVKAIYVACEPDQPVHAVEVRHMRFSSAVCIPGARCGMDADASVTVEFVDYDCDRRTRAYWHKWEDCDCPEEYYKKYPKNPCKKPPKKCKPWPCNLHCTRKFDVFVVLRIAVKVMCDREVLLQPGFPGFPLKPKG